MSGNRERAAWLGWPIWGLAVAAIFLSYNALGGTEAGLADRWQRWLWVPWVGLGIAGSRTVASALDVEGPDWRDPSFWTSRVAGIAVFAAVEGLVELAPAPAGPNAANLVFSGAIAAALAVFQRVQLGLDPRPGVALGSLLVGLAYALPGLLAVEVLRGLAAALAVALGFVLVGALGLALGD